MNCPFCNKEAQAYSNIVGFYCRSTDANGYYHSFRYHEYNKYDLVVGSEKSGYIKSKRDNNKYSLTINNDLIMTDPFEYELLYKIILKYNKLLPFL